LLPRHTAVYKVRIAGHRARVRHQNSIISKECGI
jgi:hypothetical protein